MTQTSVKETTDRELASALRILAIDAVQEARSGHPGAPMGMAEMAVALWHRRLKHDPADPQWPDRDRFVLSNGHASMLLYALLHLSGYDLPLSELRRFRQWGSRTPGHPEVGHTPGVETTTGPLGQGLANAVGMALGEKLLADEFNRPGHTVIDHRTFAFVGDGCLMEGLSHEACSLAGALRLQKLCVLYDSNGISIDGQVEPWFADDTPQRFRAYGWHVIGPVDGHDVNAVDTALGAAAASDRPTLIVCRTVIGQGSPGHAGTAKVHGEPLGADEIRRTREALGWTAGPFEIPKTIADTWNARPRGGEAHEAWCARFLAYKQAFPELATALSQRWRGELPEDFGQVAQQALAKLSAAAEPVATRKASQLLLAEVAPRLPALLGGSADLTGSNLTNFPGCGAVRAGAPGGRHVNYGVREFAMASVMNGLALHGGFIPYGGTFLTFSDYARNAIRMAALMKLSVIHVLTHDSIGLGEDGPTHQPVEHAACLRLMPGLDVWRPCDATETAAAWSAAILRKGPSALLLSRQNLPPQARSPERQAQIARGGYVLSDREAPRAVLIATGSEVELAMAAQRLLDAQGVAVRVVSMPSTNVFDREDRRYQQQVLPPGLPRIAVEAGVTAFWKAYGCNTCVGMDEYGASAPGPSLFAQYGFTAERVAAAVAAELTQHAR